MKSLFKKKSRFEKLKENYRFLMKQSFELSSRDPLKSAIAHRQADNLIQEIKYLSSIK